MCSQIPLKRPSLVLSGILAASALCLPSQSEAQLGVSPSQNAAFLQELRARDPKRAEENRDVLGDAREKLEAGRALSRPEVFSPSAARPRRLVADRTGFPSQYQLGRSYLTPWYDGVAAPAPTLADASGLTAGFALEQEFEYNSFFRESLIVSSTLLFDGSYQLAENQRFTFSGGLGFNWISDNDHIDWSYFTDEFGLTLLPGTSLAYDAQFGPLSLTLYDRVSVRTYLGVLQNDLGVAATWQIAPALSWTLNYTHSTTHDVDGNYQGVFLPITDLDTLSSIVSYEVTPAISVGLEGALNWVDQGNNERINDGTLWNIGAFATWKLNENTRLRVAGGYQHQEYDNTALYPIFSPFFVAPLDNSDQSEPYYSISFSQRLSDRFSHELAAGYESNLNFGANFNSSHYINYGVTAEAWKGARITASGFIERSEESARLESSKFTRYGIDLHLAQQITSKLSSGVGYSYLRSETEQENYPRAPWRYQNDLHMFGVTLCYALTPKTNLSLGYQAFFFTQDIQTLDDHRVRLGVRVQF